MKRRFFLWLACVFLSVGVALAQTTVTGTVVSADDGQPVVGASVLVKGTRLGAVTNIDGKFTVGNVPHSAKTLLVSFIGMQTQEVAIRQGLIRVELKADTKQLDEVMVVAFGTQKKSSFTGSAAVLGSEELSKHVTTDVTNALVGSTPGLQLRGGMGTPGGSEDTKLQIRGVSSLYSETKPLIIVDGAPYSASLNNIPQEDIESVTVLKDAASAALYGARGASGVIIVTTKTGKNKVAQINVDMKWGANTRSVQDYETIADPGLYYETFYGQYYGYFTDRGSTPAEANQKANKYVLNHLGYNIYTVPDGELLIGADGKLNPHATLGRSYQANGETYYLTNDNWRDAAYHTAFRQEYNVSASGAMDKGSFYANMNYLDEDGMIEFSGYKRLAARFKADYQAKSWLKLTANVGYTNSTTRSNPNLSATAWNNTNLMYYTSLIAPIYPIYVRVLDADGNPQVRTDSHGNPQYDYGVAATNYPGLSRPFLSPGNPLGANRYNDYKRRLNKLNGTFMADVTLTDFLKFNATSTLDWSNRKDSELQSGLYGPKVSVNGQIEKKAKEIIEQNHVQTLTYFDHFGKHNVNALLGHEYYDRKTTWLSAYGMGLFSEAIPELDAAAKKADASSYTEEYNVEGYFGSVQYNYDDRYFASASYRRDASSRFAKDRRWGDFWSVGAAWLVNKEAFFHAPWVDELKLKFSIGQQGNDNIGERTMAMREFAFTDMYNLVAASDSQMSATFWRIGNPEITWETATNLNIGLEFSLFSGRLSGSLDYYNKTTTDLLFWLSVPEAAGSRGYYGNAGDIRNSGVELSLVGSPVRTKDVDWSLSFNIAHNKDKILRLPASKTALTGGFIEQGLWYVEGGPIYNKFLPEYAGVNEKGEALYYVDSQLGAGVTNRPGTNRDETTTDINSATRYAQGRSMPVAYGGFGTQLTAYGFDLSLSFDYQLGGKIYDSAYQELMSNTASASDAGRAFHKDVLRSWTPENKTTGLPRLYYGDKYTAGDSDRWLTSARYLNFQSFSVGYTLPQRVVARLGLNKLRIYATGENLYFWSARKGLDPRYAYDETEALTVYSPMRTIMGGIQLSF